MHIRSLLLILGLLASASNIAHAEEADALLWTMQPRKIDQKTQKLERLAPLQPSVPDRPKHIYMTMPIKAQDGANFTSGGTRYRLAGVTPFAPSQICKGAAGQRWACGLRARTELMALLMKKGTFCIATSDSLDPVVVTCSYLGKDIAANLAANDLTQNP